MMEYHGGYPGLQTNDNVLIAPVDTRDGGSFQPHK